MNGALSQSERIEALALLVRVEGPTTASQRAALEQIQQLARELDPPGGGEVGGPKWITQSEPSSFASAETSAAVLM